MRGMIKQWRAIEDLSASTTYLQIRQCDRSLLYYCKFPSCLGSSHWWGSVISENVLRFVPWRITFPKKSIFNSIYALRNFGSFYIFLKIWMVYSVPFCKERKMSCCNLTKNRNTYVQNTTVEVTYTGCLLLKKVVGKYFLCAERENQNIYDTCLSQRSCSSRYKYIYSL